MVSGCEEICRLLGIKCAIFAIFLSFNALASKLFCITYFLISNAVLYISTLNAQGYADLVRFLALAVHRHFYLMPSPIFNIHAAKALTYITFILMS